MKPLVSILIPAYNAERWVGDAITSALQQTWPEKEVIVVDDGSTDNTLAVARQFASKDVAVVTQPNQGAAATRNKAFSICQGDYIQWLDADDLLDREKITNQLQKRDDNCSTRTLFSSAWGHFFYRYRKARFNPTSLWSDLSPTEWLLRKMGQSCHMQTATWLVSRELTQTAGLWNTDLLGDDDGEYFCRVLMASDGIRFSPTAKVYYRMTGSNRLSYVGASNRKMEAQFLSMQLHIRYLCSLEDSARTRRACLNYLQYYLIDFYPERPDIVAQMHQLATELGGKLGTPHFRWKYAWMRPLFGPMVAKRAQFLTPQVKAFVIRSWEKIMFALEPRPSPSL